MIAPYATSRENRAEVRAIHLMISTPDARHIVFRAVNRIPAKKSMPGWYRFAANASMMGWEVASAELVAKVIEVGPGRMATQSQLKPDTATRLVQHPVAGGILPQTERFKLKTDRMHARVHRVHVRHVLRGPEPFSNGCIAWPDMGIDVLRRDPFGPLGGFASQD